MDNTAAERASLIDQKFDLEYQVAAFEDMRSLLERLTSDERMRPVYVALAAELQNDEQYIAFIRVAEQCPHINHELRNEIKRAKVLAERIASTADQLSELLTELKHLDPTGYELGVPPNLRRLDGLLYEFLGNITDAIHAARENLFKEARIEELGLADLSGREPPSHVPSADETNILDTLFQASRLAQVAEDLRPATIDVVQSIAKTAREFAPAPRPNDAAAISSQKSNRKAELLRFFWHGFSSWHGCPTKLTPALKKAIAGTVVVIVNEADFDVSYDDVRKALEDFEP